MRYTVLSYTERTIEEHLRTVSALANIDKLCFEGEIGYDAHTFCHLLTRPNFKLVIARDENDAIQGLCLYRIDENNYLHICNLAVHPDSRGHNLGFLMMQKAVEVSSTGTPATVTLECRPINESYYKKMGFKVMRAPTPNYYQVSSQLALPSIFLQATKLHGFPKSPSTTFDKQKCNDALLGDLLVFTQKVKKSTSFWYSSSRRSARKEKAFEAIYMELLATKDSGKQLSIKNAEDILRAIIANSLITRGWFDGRTNSSNKALACLNKPEYARLKALITDSKTINRADLKAFSQLKTTASSTYKNSYPYCHFYKLPVRKVEFAEKNAALEI